MSDGGREKNLFDLLNDDAVLFQNFNILNGITWRYSEEFARLVVKGTVAATME